MKRKSDVEAVRPSWARMTPKESHTYGKLIEMMDEMLYKMGLKFVRAFHHALTVHIIGCRRRDRLYVQSRRGRRKGKVLAKGWMDPHWAGTGLHPTKGVGMVPVDVVSREE